jgi:hypothetical protein
MKDGTVAEMGTHEELMPKNGEYAKLYNVQASAFLSSASAEADIEAVEEVSFMAKLRRGHI